MHERGIDNYKLSSGYSISIVDCGVELHDIEEANEG